MEKLKMQAVLLFVSVSVGLRSCHSRRRFTYSQIFSRVPSWCDIKVQNERPPSISSCIKKPETWRIPSARRVPVHRSKIQHACCTQTIRPSKNHAMPQMHRVESGTFALYDDQSRNCRANIRSIAHTPYRQTNEETSGIKITQSRTRKYQT